MLKLLYSSQAQDVPSKVIRVMEPLRRLAQAGGAELACIEALSSAGQLGPEQVVGYDGIFLHLIDMNKHAAAYLMPVLAAAVRGGVALLCDTDDPYVFAADGCSFEAELAPHLELRKRLYAAAHVVTVSTAPLKEELSPYARQIAVIPNFIDMNGPVRAAGNTRVRFGWSGGPTHADDLAMFLPAMAKLQKQAEVDFIIFGMFDRNFEATVERARLVPLADRRDPALASFGRMADALAGVRYQHVPSVPYAQFPQALADLNLDVGVCPLLDTRFNRCRSAVKFHQYAAVGTLTVASDVAPYQNQCSLLAENTEEGWLARLAPLVNDPSFREEALRQQRQAVRATHDWQVGLALYERLFTSVCAAVKRGARA